MITEKEWLQKWNAFKEELEKLIADRRYLESEIKLEIRNVALDDLRDPNVANDLDVLQEIVDRGIIRFLKSLKVQLDRFWKDYLGEQWVSDGFSSRVEPLHELIFKVFEVIDLHYLKDIFFQDKELNETIPLILQWRMKRYFVKAWIENLEDKYGENPFPVDIKGYNHLVDDFLDEEDYEEFADFALENFKDDNRKI